MMYAKISNGAEASAQSTETFSEKIEKIPSWQQYLKHFNTANKFLYSYDSIHCSTSRG